MPLTETRRHGARKERDGRCSSFFFASPCLRERSLFWNCRSMTTQVRTNPADEERRLQPFALKRVGRVRRACERPEYLDGCDAHRNPTRAATVGLCCANPTYDLISTMKNASHGDTETRRHGARKERDGRCSNFFFASPCLRERSLFWNCRSMTTQVRTNSADEERRLQPFALKRVGRVRRACQRPEYLDGCDAHRNPTRAATVGLCCANPTYDLISTMKNASHGDTETRSKTGKRRAVFEFLLCVSVSP